MTRAHASAPEASGRAFVGRKSELAELRAGLDRALAGRGQVFLVAGEPGIGKSEFADRLAAEAVTRGAVVRILGDEATRQRELREAHRLLTAMGATARAEQVARELGA